MMDLEEVQKKHVWLLTTVIEMPDGSSKIHHRSRAPRRTPTDEQLAEAIENLRKLSGREHFQISGLAIAINNKVVHEKHYKAILKMRDLSLDEIQEYVEKDDPLMSSGSYKYESLGKNLFEYIKGDPYVIQGLPLEAIKNFFK